MPLRLSDVASSDAIQSTAEAVGLVLAAMDACEALSSAAGEHYRLPDGDQILLDKRGHLSFSVDLEPAIDDGERVTRVTRLLRQVLQLDGRDGSARLDVPGALALLVARLSGEIDLPSPTYVALRGALRRFGSPEATALASVYRRTARNRESKRIPLGRVAAIGAALAASVVLAIAISFAVRPNRRVAPEAPSIRDAVTVETFDVRIPAHPGRVSSGSRKHVEYPGVSLEPLLTSAVVGADVFSPSFAPEGGALLFHSGRNRSALMRATFDRAGSPAVETVLQDDATNYHATLSPDGKWLAYDSDRDGTRAVYIVDVDAGDPRKISGDGYAAVPRWSPDGRQLAFIKAEASHPRVWNVWIADAVTGTVSRVSRHKIGQAWGASWFPDGQRIAYSVEDRLVLANVSDGTTRVVRSPRPGQLIRTPAVSPDGTRIVFQVYHDGTWLLDVNSGAMHRILNDAAAEEFAWSADGRRIVFHTRRSGAWSVWQIGVAG